MRLPSSVLVAVGGDLLGGVRGRDKRKSSVNSAENVNAPLTRRSFRTLAQHLPRVISIWLAADGISIELPHAAAAASVPSPTIDFIDRCFSTVSYTHWR